MPLKWSGSRCSLRKDCDVFVAGGKILKVEKPPLYDEKMAEAYGGTLTAFAARMLV